MKHSDKLAVTVNTTNKCNLRCEYCMASSGEEQSNTRCISLDFAKCGIKDAIEGYPTGTKATILRFFSPGEPTQAINLMRECVDFARKLLPEIKTELQTNGLFITAQDTEWIAKNFNSVWFSLDGPSELNDKHRPGVNGKHHTAEIEDNLHQVSKATFAGVRATVVEEYLDRQEELVRYYHTLGIKYLGLNPVIRPIKRNDYGLTTVTKSENGIMRFAKGFLKAYEEGCKLGVNVLSSLTFNFDQKTKVACRSCIPMPQLNPDGSVSSCDMALYADTKKELQCFIYGSWNEEEQSISYDQEKIKGLKNRMLPNLPKCQNCIINDFCAGGCAGRIAYEKGSIYDVIPDYCRATMYLANNMVLGRQSLEYTHP